VLSRDEPNRGRPPRSALALLGSRFPAPSRISAALYASPASRSFRPRLIPSRNSSDRCLLMHRSETHLRRSDAARPQPRALHAKNVHALPPNHVSRLPLRRRGDATSFRSRDRSHPCRRVPIPKTNRLRAALSRSHRKARQLRTHLLDQLHPIPRAANKRNIHPWHPTARRTPNRPQPILVSLPLP